MIKIQQNKSNLKDKTGNQQPNTDNLWGESRQSHNKSSDRSPKNKKQNLTHGSETSFLRKLPERKYEENARSQSLDKTYLFATGMRLPQNEIIQEINNMTNMSIGF